MTRQREKKIALFGRERGNVWNRRNQFCTVSQPGGGIHRSTQECPVHIPSRTPGRAIQLSTNTVSVGLGRLSLHQDATRGEKQEFLPSPAFRRRDIAYAPYVSQPFQRSGMPTAHTTLFGLFISVLPSASGAQCYDAQATPDLIYEISRSPSHAAPPSRVNNRHVSDLFRRHLFHSHARMFFWVWKCGPAQLSDPRPTPLDASAPSASV